MKNCNNQKCNIYFPDRDYPQRSTTNDQTPLIIGLGFMCIMLFGLVIALLVAIKI
jgi:hypothetical protein